MSTPLLNCEAKEVIRGNASDVNGGDAPGVIVRLYVDNKMKAFTTTGKDGSFSITVPSPEGPGVLRFLSQKYETLEIPVSDFTYPVKAELTPRSFELQEVTVKAPERRIKGDTIVYDVSALTKSGDKSIEDIIRRIPGVEVDEGGRISYDGKSINHFYIEDLDLMGRNYTVASRSINPSDIKSVSVYERHQDKKVLRGEERSDQAALNLKLKKGRMLKPMGYIEGGLGAGDDVLWSVDLFTMYISPKNQTIVSGKSNDVGETYGARLGDSGLRIFSAIPFGEPSLKRERFTDNRSWDATANTLFKLSDAMTTKFNVSYSKDRESFEGLTVTEYLNPDNPDIIYSESVANRLKYQNVKGVANIEKNGDRLFLSDKLDFHGNFVDNSYRIYNGESVRQSFKDNNYRLDNKLQLIVKNRGSLFKIDSETSFFNSPEGYMCGVNEGTDFPFVKQRVKLSSLYNKEKTSVSFRLSRRITVGSDVSFEFNHDRFKSEGVKEETEQASNSLSGYRVITQASPFVRFNIRGLEFEAKIPLSLYNLKYNNIITSETARFDRVVVDFNAMLFKKFNRMNVFSMSFGRKNIIGDLSDYIDNPIFTTFRNSRTMGAGMLQRGHDNYVNGVFSFSDILNGAYFRVMASYNRTDKNTMNVNDVSESGTSNGIADRRSKGDVESIAFSSSKELRKLHATVYLNASGIWSSNEGIRSSVAVRTNMSLYTVSAKIETYQLSDRMMVSGDVSYSCQKQKFGEDIPKNSTNRLSFAGKLAVYPVKGLELYYTIDLSRVKIEEGNYRTNLFMDSGARYSLKRFDFEVTARNLTDMRKYEITRYHAMDITYTSFNLRPFEVVASVKFRF